MRKAIGIDMDGCVTNFVHGFTKLANKVSHSAPVLGSHYDMPEWEFRGWYIPDDNHLENIVLEDTWRLIKGSDSFWKYLTPQFPHDLDALVDTARTQPLVFITRRDGVDAYGQTLSWLRNHGINEPLLVRVTGGEEKSSVCKALGIEVMVEDSPKYGAELIRAGVTLMMPEYDYNRQFIEENYGAARPVQSLREGIHKAIMYVNH